ncbi:MAG TPA: response regulator [Terriglobales bacterium]|nr:response regulator [Terriglobales bacterium]
MKTVLIADDEESLRTLIETTLEAPGLRVLHAANGDQAVEVARREHPDLILLDWMMPGKTGIEVAEALRGEPATADIAILMLTAMGHEQDRQRGLALGIRAYLVKPFSPLQLLECVRHALASQQRNDVHEPMQRG